MTDNFADSFANYFTENEHVYGDTEQGMEEAYADFVEAVGEQDLDSEADAFADFYSEMEGMYDETEEGMEEAYADFLEIVNAENGEEEYSELEEDFMEFYNDLSDVYGDTEEGMEEAYADFMDAISDEEEFYADEAYSMDDDLLEEFADFYADTEDIYGDDVEAAFDDYADALEVIAEEDAYAHSENKQSKSYMHNRNRMLGLTSSGIVNGFTKDGKRRKYLIAKDEIDTLSPAEIKELRKKNHTRNSGVAGSALGAVAGGAVGAGLGYAVGGKNRAIGAAIGGNLGAGVGAVGGHIVGRKKARANDVNNYNDVDVYADDAAAAKPSMWDRTKGAFNSRKAKIQGSNFNSNLGRAGVGAVAGSALGAVIGGVTDKNNAERKALKAKAKAGNITASEQAKLSELQKARKARMLKATAGGAVAGGAVGYGSRAVAGAAKHVKGNMEWNKAEGKSKYNQMFKGIGSGAKANHNNGAWKSKEANKSFLGETSNDRTYSGKDVQAAKDAGAGSYVLGLIKG
mgnify:CR=1 FL=1